MKMKIFIGTLALLLIGSSFGGNVIRLVVPTDDEAASDLKEGELIVDNGTNELKVYSDGNLVSVMSDETESLPSAYYVTSNQIDITKGSIIIEGVKYSNSSGITCSFLSQGVGGYDVQAPSNYPVNYVYLVPDSSGFDCVISHLSTSPQTVSGPSRRLMSFFNSLFINYYGETTYTGSGAALSLSGPNATCTKLFPSIPSSVKKVTWQLDCSPTSGYGFQIYTDSGCSEQVSLCEYPGSGLRPQVISGKDLYILGTMSGTNVIKFTSVSETVRQ